MGSAKSFSGTGGAQLQRGNSKTLARTPREGSTGSGAISIGGAGAGLISSSSAGSTGFIARAWQVSGAEEDTGAVVLSEISGAAEIRAGGISNFSRNDG